MSPKFMQTIAVGTKKAWVITKVKAPTILTVTGIITGVAATVVAVKRSPKCAEVKEKFDHDIKKAEDCLNEKTVELKDGSKIEYTEEVYKKDIHSITAKKVLGYIRVYAPAAILTLTSIVCILSAHNMMRARNAALTATIASISEAFNHYRANVKDTYGEEIDYMLRHDLHPATDVIREKDPETGTPTKTTRTTLKKKENVERRGNSDYARCYMEGCVNWLKNADMNRMTLMNIETWCNDQLRRHGYLFLNDVYRQLGFERTKAGSEMGWIYYKNEDNPYGDNYISFGFDRDARFMEGLEHNVWLDFNVDDIPIKDRIRWKTI